MYYIRPKISNLKIAFLYIFGKLSYKTFPSISRQNKNFIVKYFQKSGFHDHDIRANKYFMWLILKCDMSLELSAQALLISTQKK